MAAVAIIPARGGSKRLPRKNIADFFGKPIIAYPIDAARQSGLFDEIIVSTDTVAIADVAHDLGCRVHWRVLDDGTRGTQEVAAEVLRDSTDASGGEDVACVIYATSPLLLADDIRRALGLLKGRYACYVMTVQAEPLADAGCLYMGWCGSFLKGLPLIDTRTVLMPLPPERVCDINTAEDFDRAKRLYQAMRSSA